MPTYEVYLREARVGTLESDRGRLAFRYHEDVVEDHSIHPLSVRLPKRTEPFDDAVARAFFENLLPESQFRRLVARALDLSPENTAGLLGAIGGECAGAVSVWPQGESHAAKPRYRAITVEWLHSVFAPEDAVSLAHAQEEARLSLAGVEEKLALRRDGDRWSLPLGGSPSSHILKRPPSAYPSLAENELYCMRLARSAGLEAVDAELLDAGEGLRLFATRRFDRVIGGDGNIVRRHQEDFCQALGAGPGQKYESEGGPSLGQAARVIREVSSLPVADLAHLVRWTAFNYLIGNEDAHGKNLALLYDAVGAIRLAPFYDLLCTDAYKGLKRKAAMKIGGEYRHRFVGRDNWARLATDIELPPRAVSRYLRETADNVREAVDGGAAFPVEDRANKVLHQIRTLVLHRADVLLKNA
jgi:serine/threonine-protein kinase HipA